MYQALLWHYLIVSLSYQIERPQASLHGGRDMSGEQDQVAGKAKELQGKITGDKERESEGVAQHAAGKVEGAVGDAADRAKGAAEGVKESVDDER
jgi:uncharacterized protein YjbJ (UPF0337 family)